MRQALHQGSPTCRRFHRRVVEYACGTRPSPEPVTVGPASDCCWNHLWQKVVGDFMPQCGGVVCGCFDRCGGGETPRGSGKGQSNGPARLAVVQLFSLSQPGLIRRRGGTDQFGVEEVGQQPQWMSRVPTSGT